MAGTVGGSGRGRGRGGGVLAVVILVVAASGGWAAGTARAATTITVTTTADETAVDGNCSLEEAIEAANTHSAVDACPAGTGNDSIVLAAGAVYTLDTVADTMFGPNGLPDVTGTMTIVGNGSTITRGGSSAFRMADVAAGGSLTLTEVNVSGFDSPASSGSPGLGGAILNLGSLVLDRSTVSGNRAEGPGGGVDARGGAIWDAGALSVTNSTISGNTAVGSGGSVGGGVIVRPGAAATITSSTFAVNSGNNGADIESESSALTITDTIMASGCLMEAPLVDGGHNLDVGTSCGFDAATDLRNTNPQLGALTGNGGPTPTQALAPGSPAVDAGGTSCPPADGGVDQRGLPRFSPCDIGAYEVQDQTPVLTAASGLAFSEAASMTATVATLSDGDAPSGDGDFTATIDWGDGSATTGTITPVSGQPTHFTVGGTHTYADEGKYSARISVDDADTGVTSTTAVVTVADAALGASGGDTLTGIEGTLLSGAGPYTAPVTGTVASFTDANPSATTADFTATIAWGDGTTSAGSISGPTGGPFTVSGSHTYTEDGSYSISVVITDDGGSTANATSRAVIADPPFPFTVLDLSEDLLGG